MLLREHLGSIVQLEYSLLKDMLMFQVVILGAGPAGISTAVEAIKKGFKAEEILILEKFDEVAYMNILVT